MYIVIDRLDYLCCHIVIVYTFMASEISEFTEFIGNLLMLGGWYRITIVM